MSIDFRIHLLGPLRIYDRNGAELNLGQKAKAIVGFLAWEIEAPCARRRLQDTFWSNADHERGSGNLKKALQRLGHHFNGALITRNGHVQLHRPSIWVDVHDDPACRQSTRAVMEGVDIRDEQFEDWLRRTRSDWLERQMSPSAALRIQDWTDV